jgi:hypothetical protein
MHAGMTRVLADAKMFHTLADGAGSTIIAQHCSLTLDNGYACVSLVDFATA